MVIIEQLQHQHYSQVSRIYIEGIATGNATFETVCPEWEVWDKEHLPYSRFVAITNDMVCGWVALSPVSGRCVYGGVAEVSVYIGKEQRGKKIGYTLLEHLINDSEARGIWSIQAGIFRENTVSIQLHQKLGFRIIGYREKLGKMEDGPWRDVILLERRSKTIGI